MKKAVIYVRVRVSEGSQEVIDRQLAVCKQYAEEQGYEVVGKYIDNEEFGKPVNRVSLARMLDESRTAAWDAVITYSADRMCRDRRKFLAYDEQLEHNGKSLLIVNAPMDAEFKQCLRAICNMTLIRSKR